MSFRGDGETPRVDIDGTAHARALCAGWIEDMGTNNITLSSHTTILWLRKRVAGGDSLLV